MQEFIRARSDDQKKQRMAEIKEATDMLFSSRSYHEITLTTIAEQLQWSRANLYKYVTSKEEIFLDLSADKRNVYFDALKAAFPVGCDYSLDVFAEVWSGILNSHREYLKYSDILFAITETNVSVDKLAAFKKNYYERSNEIIELLSKNLHISLEEADTIFYDVYYHAVGINSSCLYNPLVQQALTLINMEVAPTDFKQNLKRFISMCLQHYCRKE